MSLDKKPRTTVALAALLFLTISGLAWAEGDVIELNFGQSAVASSDTVRTLQSLVKVQGTGGLLQDGLYLMSHFGDREDLFQKENQRAIDSPWRDDTWRYCSIFATASTKSVLLGRNWDNQNVGSIIVSRYHPPKGYSSVSFARAIDMGFPLNMDLVTLKSSELGNKLLLAPFYATEGINEHGLAVAVAGVKQTTHQPKDGEQLVFVTYLVRKILDQTRTIDEAVRLAETFVPFDLDKTSLNTHFLIADSSGKSVILEYAQDQWRTIYADHSRQVMTNDVIYNVPDAKLRDQCKRYRGISEALDTTTSGVDWQAAMKLLQNASQKGTAWSVVYSLRTRELYFSVYQNWSVRYHLSAL